MNLEQQIPSIGDAAKSRKRFTRSLEYELIANLALQQYRKDDGIHFEGLLAIPLKERIPGLVQEYGLKRMHRMIKMVLQEFCYSIALPKSRKLTDTRIAVCACDLLLAADEDQLSMEDLIIFFEGAREGRYGKFRGTLTHFAIMQKLEQYRQLRFEAYERIKSQREAIKLQEGPLQRISTQPTAIKHLFDDAIMPLKKIS